MAENYNRGNVVVNRRSFVKGAFGAGMLGMLSLAGLTGCAPKSEQSSDIDGGTFDIVVIGAGGAGMTAAISSHDAGAKVILLEKMSVAGGNTVCAEGGMNACCTKVQAEEGIEDSVELFANDTFVGGHNLGNMDLINFMCENSNAALERLSERGMYLTRLSTSGGASVKRIHRPEDGSAVGAYLVRHMCERCAERGIEAVTQMDVKEIVTDESGAVAGVRAVNLRTGASTLFNAKAVILAAGGFGANHQMLAQYRPELLEAVTTNHPGATGDGIVMAEAIGAGLVDIEQIQVHPTVEQSTSILLSEGIRGDGAILVNSEGNRFTNELLTRDVVSANEWAQPGGWAYAIFDHEVYEANTSIENKFVKRDLVVIAETLEELSQNIEVNPENFMAALTAYNDAIANNQPDPMGREKSRYPIVNAPFYAVKVAPGIHHTMGGVRINTKAEVLTDEGEVIPGLYAAGEVTGGIHGGNRLGGNAICDINVFGHRAAESAVEYVGVSAS